MRHTHVLALLLLAFPAIAQTPAIEPQNAWARATAPHAEAGGVFLTLTDRGLPDALIGASTPISASAEVHETVRDGDIMRMRATPSVPLPTGKSVELKPGGLHIMLMGLKQQLKPGDQFPLTLRFEHAQPVTVTVTVGAAGAAAH